MSKKRLLKRIITTVIVILAILWSGTACYNIEQTRSTKASPSAFNMYEQAVKAQIKGEFRQALRLIDRALQLNPRISLFYAFKAQIYDSLNVLDSALVFYQRSLQFRSHAPEILNRLGELNLCRGDTIAALRYFKRSFNEDHQQIERLLKIAEIFLNQKRLGRAEEALREYRVQCRLQNRTPQPRYNVLMGELLFLKKQPVQAAQFYARARCGSCFSEQQARRALQTLFKQGDLEGYFSVLSSVQKARLFPDSLLYQLRGRYYLAIGNQNEAGGQFYRAFEEGARNKEVLCGIVKYFFRPQRTKVLPRVESEIKKRFPNLNCTKTK